MTAQALSFADPAPRRSACGGVAATVAGTRTVMRASGALWLATSSTLIVSDLHFEKGSAYAARGQLLPPYDTRDTLERLDAEVEALSPRTLVFLGDTFHDGKAEDRLHPADRDRIAALASGRTLVWITGNHDADGPRALPGLTVEEMHVESLVLRHEPSAGPAPGEAAGHLHPCARVVAFGRSTRSRCFATDGERVILPAFGAYAGGLNVRDAAFVGLFCAPPLLVAITREKAHALKWRACVPD